MPKLQCRVCLAGPSGQRMHACPDSRYYIPGSCPSAEMWVPQRIQRKRTKGWRMPEGAIYVGRPSRWGNPFWIYHRHSIVGPKWHVAVDTWKHVPRDQCIWGYVTSSHPLPVSAAVKRYRDVLSVRQRDEPERFLKWLEPLNGRDLACWCPLDQPCHADVLLEIANGGS